MNQNLIGDDWFNYLKEEFEKEYFEKIRLQLRHEYSTYKCYPAPADIFKAFKLTPPNTVKVVMLGLDPYPHGDHADGIAFSSKQEETPFSLQRIFRECDRDVVKTTTFQEFKSVFPNNSLESWCHEGVLLLNSSLTVRAGEVGSHSYLQWNKFIQEVLKKLQGEVTPKVFIALGKEAQLNLTASMIENTQHRYIMTGHPASAAHGKDTFSGSNIFSKTNHFFYKNGLQEINWTLV